MSDCGTLEVCEIELIAERFSRRYAGKKFTQRAWNFENLLQDEGYILKGFVKFTEVIVHK